MIVTIPVWQGFKIMLNGIKFGDQVGSQEDFQFSGVNFYIGLRQFN
jgi:hypothetical protein